MNFHPIQSSILTRRQRLAPLLAPPLIVACGRGVASNQWRNARISLF